MNRYLGVNRKSFPENAIKHKLLGFHRTSHSAKILGDPPGISLIFIKLSLTLIFRPDHLRVT